MRFRKASRRSRLGKPAIGVRSAMRLSDRSRKRSSKGPRAAQCRLFPSSTQPSAPSLPARIKVPVLPPDWLRCSTPADWSSLQHRAVTGCGYPVPSTPPIRRGTKGETTTQCGYRRGPVSAIGQRRQRCDGFNEVVGKIQRAQVRQRGEGVTSRIALCARSSRSRPVNCSIPSSAMS